MVHQLQRYEKCIKIRLCIHLHLHTGSRECSIYSIVLDQIHPANAYYYVLFSSLQAGISVEFIRVKV
jgi:hypothetical protein